jgi:hypothetical protein
MERKMNRKRAAKATNRMDGQIDKTIAKACTG